MVAVYMTEEACERVLPPFNWSKVVNYTRSAMEVESLIEEDELRMSGNSGIL